MRKGRQEIGYQSARVLVNGKLIGTWQEPLADSHSRWRADSFDVPGSFPPTVTVRVEPVAGSWSVSTCQAVTAPIG